MYFHKEAISQVFLYLANFANFAKFWVLNLAFREIPKAQNFLHCRVDPSTNSSVSSSIHPLILLLSVMKTTTKYSNMCFSAASTIQRLHARNSNNNRQQPLTSHLGGCISIIFYKKKLMTDSKQSWTMSELIIHPNLVIVYLVIVNFAIQ